MGIDLFEALLDKVNPRGHPILAALSYAFCPAAARWWLAGADPAVQFDPLRQALEDRISGKTLKEAISDYGFEDLVEDVQTYVDQVDTWRDRHPGIDAPERLPTFTGGRIAVTRRFGHRAGIRKFGGRWEHFFTYVRAWAFLVRDWEVAMRFTRLPRFSRARLALTLPGIRRPVTFPAWSWKDQVKGGRRVVVGFIGEPDQLLLSMTRRAGLEGDQPWPSTPEVWILDEVLGKAKYFDDRLPEELLPEVVQQLADAARKGPFPPIKALNGGGQCSDCGFHAQCFTGQGEISLLALSWSSNAHSRLEKIEG
jgi:hypothetical protein